MALAATSLGVRTYSPDDLKRIRAAATVIVGANGESAQERFELVETFVVRSVRKGRSVAEVEREADDIVREEAPGFIRDLRSGDAVRWQDPGYLAWIEKRNLHIEGI